MTTENQKLIDDRDLSPLNSSRIQDYSPKWKNREEKFKPRSRSPIRGRSPLKDHSPLRDHSPVTDPSPYHKLTFDVENDGTTLYVSGLRSDSRTTDLHHLFSKYGKVENVSLVSDPRSRTSRGFAFITMTDNETADLCIQKLNQSEFEEKIIRVEKSRRNCARKPTPGQYLGKDQDRRQRRGYYQDKPRYLDSGYHPYERRRGRSSHRRYHSRSRSRSNSRDRHYHSSHSRRSRSPYRKRSRSPYYRRRSRHSRSPYHSRHSPYSRSRRKDHSFSPHRRD
ncbi:hypothetical protein M0811_07162 [Anaeramoeba ignava]|uniref:RRM domain-containing protein n=1 Tax=Anaeramoeba ignava TaxID=1746090 RepID=A0A9Q0LML3_ANAIG|nr:hypothetical protein M0811_07162 [Anaeramoeba ignava]